MIELLVDEPLVLLAVVLAGGALIGSLKVGGVSLGPAGALVVGLALSAYDERLALPELLGAFGLALFTYAVGLASGGPFFRVLRTSAPLLVAIVVVLVVAGGVARLLGWAYGLSDEVAVGMYAGALTNTPALASAVDAFNGSSEPVVGYSLAYPFGVVGMILAALYVVRLGEQKPNDDDRDRPASLTARTALVTTADGVPVGAVVRPFTGHVVVSRLRRGDEDPVVPDEYLVLKRGDLVSFTAEVDLADEVTRAFGEPAEVHLPYDRSQLDFRRIVVSNRDLVGLRLDELELWSRYGAAVTRVRRGDVDLLAHDALLLEPGDRLRVVAPRERLPEIGQLLGDSERRIGEVDAPGFMIGLALGLLVGLISVPIPGIGEVRLGFAGGPLIVGLVLGRLERTGPFLWQPPHGANLTLRQLGALVFLGVVGTRSGTQFADAVQTRTGPLVLAGGFVLTTIVAIALIVICRRGFGFGGARSAGTIAGAQTQPAVLTFALDRTPDPRVASTYALVVPFAMIAKIVTAQVIALL